MDGDHVRRFLQGMEAEGVRFANIYILHVRENGMMPMDAEEIAFKRRMDPLNLMNPGKLTSDDLGDEEQGKGATLPKSGWHYHQPG